MTATTVLLLCGAFAAGGVCTTVYLKRRGGGKKDPPRPVPPTPTPTPRPAPQPKPNKPKDKRAAKVALLENLSLITPLLQGLEKGVINKEKWKEAIVSINNEQLIQYWKAWCGRQDLAQKWYDVILKSSGIYYENCTEFTTTSKRQEWYVTENGTKPEIGKAYAVLSPCWLFSQLDENYQESISILHKGIVKLK